MAALPRSVCHALSLKPQCLQHDNSHDCLTPPGQPPCSFMTTYHRWSALPGLSSEIVFKQPQSETSLRSGERLLALPSIVPTLWWSDCHALSPKGTITAQLPRLPRPQKNNDKRLGGNLPAASRPHVTVGPLCQGSLKQTNQSQNKWRLTQPQTRFRHDPIEMGYLTNPLKLLGFQPLPSHPYDRAKAHNKRVAIMRCLSKGVFPPMKRLA